jgi:hypothetical protein
MITREKLEEMLDSETNSPFSNPKEDHDVKAISLLRERIPIDVCGSIIGGAEHDKIYLCDIDEVLPYLTEADAMILKDCNMFIDDDCDCLSLFV